MESSRQEFQIFLGAFAKLRKTTVRFVMSLCRSAWNISVPTEQILMKFGIGMCVESLSRKPKSH